MELRTLEENVNEMIDLYQTLYNSLQNEKHKISSSSSSSSMLGMSSSLQNINLPNINEIEEENNRNNDNSTTTTTTMMMMEIEEENDKENEEDKNDDEADKDISRLQNVIKFVNEEIIEKLENMYNFCISTSEGSNNKINKYKKRLQELDPITKKSRYGIKTKERIVAVINKFYLLRYVIYMIYDKEIIIIRPTEVSVDVKKDKEEAKKNDKDKEKEENKEEEEEEISEEEKEKQRKEEEMTKKIMNSIIEKVPNKENSDNNVTNYYGMINNIIELRKEYESKIKEIQQSQEEKKQQKEKELLEKVQKEKEIQKQKEEEILREKQRQEDEISKKAEEIRNKKKQAIIDEINDKEEKDRIDKEWINSILKDAQIVDTKDNSNNIPKLLDAIRKQLNILKESTTSTGTSTSDDGNDSNNNNNNNSCNCYKTSLTALHTLYKQIIQYPENEQYRRIRRNHEKFYNDIGKYKGGCEILILSGFRLGYINDIQCFISTEPNITDLDNMDEWSNWFDLLKGTFNILDDEIKKII